MVVGARTGLSRLGSRVSQSVLSAGAWGSSSVWDSLGMWSKDSSSGFIGALFRGVGILCLVVTDVCLQAVRSDVVVVLT